MNQSRPFARRFIGRAAAALAVSVCVLFSPSVIAQQGPPRFLAKEEIVLYGIGLRAEPARQVVPKDIATIVSTFLQAPTQPNGLPAFAPDAEVRATLRGPSFPEPVELVVKPNTPFNIPPLTIAGIHTLENIRLISGGEVLLRSVPESVVIEVIEKLLVTQVTARALTAAEIREKGIVFDKSSFQAYNFSAAFAIQDQQVRIDFPVVLPQIQGAQDVAVSEATIPQIQTPALPSLQTIIPDTLRLQTQIPNLSVVGFTLKVPQLEGQDLLVPPIPGVIVIPGDIGFLNQFFSVMLMVGNVAPAGSNLVVSNLEAGIVLPPGNDLVVGSGDDPLRMARTATGETPRIRLVVQPGPDGQLGTMDDVGTLAPGESGNAEYLVEGMREGSHVVEMEMKGTLSGLPVGPVEIRGRAAGAVLVRNPTFTLTFTHPEVVAAGEPYTLDVTVTNTGQSPANFVSLNLFPRNVSGASIVGSNTREVESIPPGDSATVAFDLISRITGKVTAATLDSTENVAGRFALKTAVGELGVPTSPDSLVLPKEAKSLPAGLREAALGLLGKAWAVATAPAAALPPDVQRFSRKIVFDRAVEVAEAGFRVSLHEPLADSAAHLAMDFIGNKYAWLPQLSPRPDDVAFAQDNFRGFDVLRRLSVRGDRFADAVAGVLAPGLAAQGPQAFHSNLASRWSYRPEHVSALVAGTGGVAPYRVSIVDAQSRRVGGTGQSGKVIKEVPFSDLLVFGSSGGGLAGEMAVLGSPAAGAYKVRLDKIAGVPDGTPYVLSIVVPDGAGGLRQIAFQGVAGLAIPVVPPSGDPYQITVEVFDAGAQVAGPAIGASLSPIADPPPSILGAVQQADADTLRCDAESPAIPIGRVIAVLFSEEVAAGSVQDKLSAEQITNFQIDGNQVVGVALQPGRRIAFLALRDPYGPFVPRQLTVSNVMDARGQAMPPGSVAIESTMTDEGGVLSGKVLRGDGTPVALAGVRLFYLLDCEISEPTWIGISAKTADEQGRYGWDYVSKRFIDRIVAIENESNESRDLRFNVQRNGQRLNIDVVLLGRGTFQGRTLREDGRSLGNTTVRVTSLTDNSQYGAISDADGRFVVPRIPVGNLLIEAVNVNVKAQVFLSENIPFAGAITVRDVTLLDVAVRAVTIKTGRVSGFVYRPDGVTPIADVPVITYYRTRSQPNIKCPEIGNPPKEPEECAVAVVRTGVDGSFLLDKVTSGELRFYAFDQASLAQGGAHVVLPADGQRALNILLAGGLGTVIGRVVDPAGVPLVGARVGGGFTLTTTGAGGEFTLTDVPVGRRDIVAVSDALGTLGSVTVDIVRAGEVVGVTIVLQSVGSVAGRVVRADGTTPVANVKVHLFRYIDSDDGPKIQIFGTATTDATGGYRIDKVQMGSYTISSFEDGFADGNIGKVALKFHQQVFKADIKYRGGGGIVRGVVYDDDGQTPLKARLGLSGDQLIVAGGLVGVGFKYVQNYQIVDTPLTTGEYAFSGLWVGGFTLRAVGQFSPDPIAVDGEIPAPNEIVTLNLRLKATSQIGGVVLQPDGVTPVGANVVINYKSEAFKVICVTDQYGLETCETIPQGIQSVNAVTDQNGRFFFPIVNAGAFTLTADDPATGKVAQVKGSVKAGETADLSLRLLGIAELTVQVFGSDTTTPIANAKVEVEQVAYPRQKKTLIAGPDGAIVFAGGDAFSEGELMITATDQGSGFVGRAPGRIVKDGQNVLVKVYLYNASGTVYGVVYRSDGLTPVPNAEIIISNAAGPLAFTVTGADGTYRQEKIPLGPFFVETFEAATARRAFASGLVYQINQEVPANLVQGALGIVRGTLVQGGTLTALKGWEVSLDQTTESGRLLQTLKTTTSVDGSWSFPGTSRGTFRATARKASIQGTTSASGEIEREGQIVEVPLVVTTLRPLAGRVEGTIFNADGTPAANSIVEVCYAGRCIEEVPPVRVTADADGSYSVDDVPLGRFSVTAAGQINRNVGRRFGDMELDGDILRLDVVMVGLTIINGTVIRSDGTPATSAIVKLDGRPASGCAGPCTQGVKPADGSFSFLDVPARTFTVSAVDPVTGLKGAAGGTVNPGELKVVTVVLEPTGVVSGRVLRAAGQPAEGIVAELILSPGSQTERRLYLETLPDGFFAFDPAPLGNFTLVLQDPEGPGLAQRSGSVAGGGALGDILLDEAPPSVASTTPPASAVGVPRNQTVRVVFTEPILPGSVNQTNVLLEGPAGPVAYTLAISEGDTVATLTPIAPLADETRYVIKIENVKDRLGKLMPARFTASFTTVDVTAPSFASVVPAPGANGVPITTPVRIQFSEPVDPAKFRAPPFTLTGPLGPVAGRLDYIFGNTVLVFTPNLPLAADAAYRAVMSAAVDAAGNTQAHDLDYTFTTTDRTPPQILGLVAPGSMIENTTATVTATLGVSHDVAVVDWYINDVLVLAARAFPFALSFKATPAFGAPGTQIKVSAIAIDTSGNRGVAPVSTQVAVVADQGPSVSILAPAGPISARNGDRITVDVRATDDVGLTQVGYKAGTGHPQDAATRAFDPAVATRTESFAFTVPPSAAPGSSILIEASALDTKGNVVKAAPVSITVLDAVNPAVAITGTTSGAKVNPGQTTTAIVAAEDLGGISSVTFTVGGALVQTETRTVNPARDSVAASFSIQVPQNAQPGQSLTLDATATDAAGNRGTAARIILPVADTVAPTVRLRTANGSNEMVRGQPITVVVDAEDEIALSRVELTGQGAFTLSDAKPVSPPLGSASVPFTFTVPATLDPGAILTLRTTAVDISGNVSAPALLTLSVKSLVDVTLPASTLLIAGESQAVSVQLAEPAPAGGLRVDFTSTNTTIVTVTPSVVFAAGETTRPIQVTGVSGGTATIRALIQGVQRSSMTATVRGGIVRGVVFNSALQPVAGVQLTINSAVTATTNGAGEFFAEGVPGTFVTVKALDPVTRQRGYATTSMNRANGFANVNVLLIPAGAITGDVKTVAGDPAGAGVRVDIFAATDLNTLLDFTFTDAASQFEFPLVTQGSYVLRAFRTDGHRGQASVAVAGDEEPVTITFLGEGSVVGTVLDGAGVAVPRAPLTFTSVSVFGATPPANTNAEADGTFRFDRVLVGTFTVQARDDVTGRAGTTSGTIAQNAQVVTADVHLSTYGMVRGVILRPDGTTPVVGALVHVNGNPTLSNGLGEYSVPFLPLGPFTVTVNDQGTRQQGRATGTLTTQNEVKVVNVTLHPQGSVIVTVTDASGNLVEGASVTLTASGGGFSDTLTGKTGADGTVVIDRVLAGSFQVAATSGALRGQISSTLNADEVKRVTVTLEPTGSITGVVYEPDGQTPAAGARVSLSGSPQPTLTTGADGVYRFDGLPLPPSYAITVTDAQGRLRARTATTLKVVFPGQVLTSNFTMVGLGTVTGRVLNPDASSAQNLVVSIYSFNPGFGGLRVATTNAGGFYALENVPVGPFSVSTGDPVRQLLGEGAGVIGVHGVTATVDILLVSNAIATPVTRFDGNNYVYDVQRDGSLRSGTLAFRSQGGLLLDVIGQGGVATRFEGSTIATIESAGREVVLRQQGLAGLNVTRKVFVPRQGYFARYLEIFSNPTVQPVTIDVRLSSELQHVVLLTTSSGDASLDVTAPDTADRWIVMADPTNVPPGTLGLALVFDGAGALDRADQAAVSPSSPRDLVVEWQTVTIPANGTVAFMHFVAQQTGGGPAQASAERLAQLPPEALDGLSADEIAQVANFSIPADGLSTVPALPPLTGVVEGRVLASDGTTPVASSNVQFKSASPFFARTHQIITGADGRFVFAGAFNDSGTSRAIPIDGFTLRAQHPLTALQSPLVTSSFPAGSTTIFQDAVFTNTGRVHGTVRLNGAAIGGAPVVATGTVNGTPYSLTTQSAADGSYAFALVPSGNVSVRATTTVQGTQVTATVATSVADGVQTEADVSLDSLAPQLTIVSPTPGSLIDPRSPLAVTVNASDLGGVATISFTSTGSVVRAETRGGPPATTRTEVFTVPFEAPLPIGGSITLTVVATDTVGHQTTTSLTLTVRDVVPPLVTLVAPADAATGVEPGAVIVVQFSEPIDRASVTASSVRVTTGQTVVPVSLDFSADNRTVTFTPAQALASNATHTVTLDSSVADPAGNGLSAPFVSTFTTRPADVVSPRVVTVEPAPSAVDVPIGVFIQITFTEPLDPSTINAASVRVSSGGTALAGALALLDGNSVIRFSPAQPLPLSSVIVTELMPSLADPTGNKLADASGNPLTQPLTFTFLTASFGITLPAHGEDVVENRPVTLEAQGSASLGIASVVFEVNGQALPAVTGPPFSTLFSVPSAATTPTLTIVATGRNSAGVEVARDQVTAHVVVGLRVSPTLVGVPRGGSARVRLGLSSPIGVDLPITLTAGDPSVLAVPAQPVVLPAGQLEAVVSLGGTAVGNTTMTASSTRGDGSIVVSVSEPVPTTVRTEGGIVGLRVLPIALVGRVFESAGGRRTISLQLLSAPASSQVNVVVSSSNSAVARVDDPVTIAAGQMSASVTIVAGVGGTATLTFRVGNEIRQVEIVVGQPPAGTLGPILSPVVSVGVLPPQLLGRLLAPVAGQATVTVLLTSEPVTATTAVIITTSNAAVASVEEAVVVLAGQRSAAVTIRTGVAGTATLTFRTGGEVRQLTIVVGQPAAGEIPLTVAMPVGVLVRPIPLGGLLFSGRTLQRTIALPMLEAPLATSTTVSIISSDPNVATVLETVTIPAGALSATFTVATGVDGVATLRLSAGGAHRDLTVVVGTPPASMLPTIVAPVVRVIKQ